MNLSLRKKLLLSNSGLMLLGLGVLIVIAHYSSKLALEQFTQMRLARIADSKARNLESWMDGLKTELKHWAGNEIVKNALNGESDQESRRYLEKKKESHEIFESIDLADSKGEILLSSASGRAGSANVSDMAFFKKMAKEKKCVVSEKANTADGASLTFACPAGEKGVIFGTVPLKNGIDSDTDDKTGSVCIVGKSGKVIFSAEKFKGMEDLSQLLKGNDGGFIHEKNGGKMFIAFDKIAVTGWQVVVHYPYKAIMAPIEKMMWWNMSAAGIIVIVSLFIMLLVVRTIVRSLSDINTGLGESSKRVASASTQISASSQELAQGASEQAASLEETTASLEEMASMTKQNANNAVQADGLMKDANNVVAQAAESMAQLTMAMGDISHASEQTSKIIKTIDEIAFQTNLLALNAAVEAARAGDAGAGFAVVAEEVRNLAMRSAEAARNTASLIEGTVQKISEGSEMVSKTNDAFSAVAVSVIKGGELVGEIAAASNEQAMGIEQVNRAMSSMDKVTQQNAANAEESASASEEMNAQAGQLATFVSKLSALLGKNKRKRKILPAPKSMPELPGNKIPPAPIPSRKPVSEPAPSAKNPEQVIPFDEDDFEEF